MARQLLSDGPFVDPPVTAPLSADATTTEVAMWNSLQYTPIYANDAKAGKIYVVEAGGLITTAATGALTIKPTIGTTNAAGTLLGTSIAQTVPATSLSGPWYLRMVLVVRTVGAPAGSNATVMGEGVFQSGGVAATANSGLDLTFGGTSAAFDQSVNQGIWFGKTLSVAGSFTTHWCFIRALN